jgi:hypothetical protein
MPNGSRASSSTIVPGRRSISTPPCTATPSPATWRLTKASSQGLEAMSRRRRRTVCALPTIRPSEAPPDRGDNAIEPKAGISAAKLGVRAV